MGAQVSAFENRSSVEMEIRVFVPPARPDRYRMIIRVKPGEVKRVKTRSLLCCDEESNYENPKFIMVFMDGAYSGVCLLPFEIRNYAKILGYLDDNGLVTLKGKFRLGYRLGSCKLSLGMKNKKQVEGKYST